MRAKLKQVDEISKYFTTYFIDFLIVMYKVYVFTHQLINFLFKL